MRCSCQDGSHPLLRARLPGPSARGAAHSSHSACPRARAPGDQTGSGGRAPGTVLRARPPDASCDDLLGFPCWPLPRGARAHVMGCRVCGVGGVSSCGGRPGAPSQASRALPQQGSGQRVRASPRFQFVWVWLFGVAQDRPGFDHLTRVGRGRVGDRGTAYRSALRRASSGRRSRFPAGTRSVGWRADLRWPTPRASVALEEVTRMPS